MILIIGTGHLSRYFENAYKNTHLLDISKYDDLHEQVYEYIFITDLYENRSSSHENDMENVCKLQSIILKIKYNVVIFFSTTDIYNCSCLDQREDDDIITTGFIGKNRYLMEQWVLSNCKSAYIIRLPRLFGMYASDHVFHQLLEGYVDEINPFDICQWYCIDNLKLEVEAITRKDHRIVNLVSEPIRTYEIISYCFNTLIPALNYTPTSPATKSRYRTKYKYTGYCYDKLYTIMLMQDSINLVNSMKRRNTRLVVSNAMWDMSWDSSAKRIMKYYNIKDVVISVNSVEDFDDEQVTHLRNDGFNIFGVCCQRVDNIDRLTNVLRENSIDTLISFESPEVEIEDVRWITLEKRCRRDNNCDNFPQICRDFIHKITIDDADVAYYLFLLNDVYFEEFERMIRFFVLNYAAAIL